VDIRQRINALDLSLFDAIDTQLTDADRWSLLALHVAWREVYGSFDYLEIGSHLGGSLQAVIRDPACRSIISIDSRPAAQPDERGFTYEYPANSTERMLRELGNLEGADLSKLKTIDASTDTIRPDSLPTSVDVCLVDGEHTDEAALRDARFSLAAIGAEGCIAFHDIQVVYRALRTFLDDLEADAVPHRCYYLPHAVFAVEVGPSRLIACSRLQRAVLDNAGGYLWSLAHNDLYREWYRRSLRHRTLEVARRARRQLRG